MKWKLVLFLFLIFNSGLFSQEIPPVPKTFIQDNVGIMEKVYWDSINNLLADLEEQTGTQFIVYIADTLNGEVLEDYVTKMFAKWELGAKGKDNGMLLAIFIKDRSFRIETGYGLEGKVPDLLSYHYQEKYLIPQFKLGNYGKGVLDCSKALADAASGYLWDFFGEKKQREVDSLIINDEARLLTPSEKSKVIYDLHIRTEYNSSEDYHLYFYTTIASDTIRIKEKMEKAWSEIQKKQSFVSNKILVVMSSGVPLFVCKADENLEKDFHLSGVNYIEKISYGKYSLDQWNNKLYYYTIADLRNEVMLDFEYNVFEKEHPIYTSIFTLFTKDKQTLIWNYDEYQILAWILVVLFVPILLIFFLTVFNKGLETKTKKIIIAWSFLNHLIPFVGSIVEIVLLFKVIKLFRKKGNYLDKIKIINQKSYFGYLNDFMKSSGGSGSYSYSSSGSSYSSGSSRSSSSSSSYSSSSSSSSSRSFGGGGGGRSGGGGSSGKW